MRQFNNDMANRNNPLDFNLLYYKINYSKCRMEEDVRIQLFQSIENNNLDGVIDCIEEGVNLEEADSHGQTPLIFAAEKGHLEIVAELLNRNVDANAKDQDGWTPLIAASKEGHVDVVGVLLENAAKYNIPDMGGWTPLVWAAYKGHTDVVHELLNYGANPEARGQHNMTALIWASGRGHTGVVSKLINRGAKAEVADKYGTTALIWACRKGHYEVIKMLLNAGANCNAVGTHGWTPIIMAAKGGYGDVLTLLLDESTNVNAVDHQGLSALGWAAKEGYEELVGKLIGKGAFLNIPDNRGDSPLIIASKEGHASVVRTLVNAYAEIEITDSDGKTALFHGVEKGHVAVVRELLLAGANTEVTNKEGETPLLRGAKRKHTQCVKLLLEKGANPAITDKKGDTPLHIAIRNRFAGLCEALLNDQKNSKILHQPNKAGETPYSIDLQNKPSILPGFFQGQQVNHDFDKMDYCTQQELLLATISEYLMEPSFSTPLTLGMYSRWGTGKSTQLKRLVELLEEAKSSVPIIPFRVTAPVVFMCILAAVILSVVFWIATDSWEVGVASAIVLVNVFLIFFVVARVTLISHSRGLRSAGEAMTNFIYRCVWFLKLIYCIPPSIQEVKPALPVHLMTVDLTRSVLVGDNPMTSLVNFIRELNDSIEQNIGIVIPRLYRIFQSGPYRTPSGGKSIFRTKWKKSCCCVPSFLISIVVFACLLVGLILYGAWKLNGPSAAIAIQIACLCVLGGFLLANLLRFFIIIYCLVLPMKKRVNFVSTQAGIQEETFLSVVKQELDLCVDMLECLDGFAQRQTRIIVHIDLLESLEQQKVLGLIDSLKFMISAPGHPFIFVLSVDPRLLIKAMDQSLTIVHGPVNAYDYLRNLVDLPFYISEPSKTKVDGLVPLELRNILEDQQISDNEESELEWDDNADINGDVISRVSLPRDQQKHDVIANGGNGHVPNGNGTVPKLRSVKFPLEQSGNDGCTNNNESISEDISNMIRTNMNGNLNDIKRVMNVISLKARILKSSDIHFQLPRLGIWVNMCDVWPHKASWFILLCMDVSLALPDKMSIRRLYNLLGYAMPMVGDHEENTGNAANYFDTFLASHKPVINVADVRMFTPFLFYLDPTIRSLMIDYMVALKSGTISKNPSIAHQFSSRSNFPISPSDSSKFIWRGGIDEQYLSKMTPEDVVSQLAEIEGIETSLVPSYRDRILENNINGRVLISCDMNELREAMQMKFGDWQLFKAWINSSRFKDNSSRSEKSYYRPSSRSANGDGSQSESIPGSPKQSSVSSYNPTQKGTSRLPALNETPDSSSNQPYTSHSPRNSPLQSRTRSGKQRKGGKSKARSLESEGSSPLKGPSPNPTLQRSADSSFASTDADNRSQQLSSFSDNEPSSSRYVQRVGSNNRQVTRPKQYHQQPQRNRVPPIAGLDQGVDSLERGTKPSDTWIGKNERSFNKTNDTISSTSSQEFIQTSFEKQEESLHQIKPWQLSDGDESCSERGNEIVETSFTSTHQKRHLTSGLRKETRPPSLSEVPLPPASMLNESHEDYIDLENHDSEHDALLSSSPPTSLDRKNAFQNSARLRGMSNYTTSTDSDRQYLVENNNVVDS
ncbi:kinase D-interacting substrate of 220 kDa B-like isoform X4 [Clytia hemisphaerica]|uniref:KAP NTPase domain-containing protein n=1 Tax=Clytia hemisphaerica TaxID=252671 RepID=A0A7M5VCV5_9CNID